MPPAGHDGFLQAMFRQRFVPQELPLEWPRAIRHVLSTPFPSSAESMMGLSYEGGMIGLASREVLLITAILRQRRNAMVEEILRRFPDGARHPGLSGTQSAEASVDGMMSFMDRVADSDQSVIDEVVDFLGAESGGLE
jgi:hypothetical protein